jgi:AraC family transcriptional regulator, transcriptional activator FtrA
MLNRRVVAVIYDGLCLFEFGIAAELFGLERPELDVPWYQFKTVSVARGRVKALGGVGIESSRNLRLIREAGLIVLPGWRDKDELPPPELLRAIRSAHARGATIMSICSGAYVLAATGLLDGQTATTHWRYAEHLAAMYPELTVQPDVLYVDNGQTLTSAGSAAGIDLGLHVIRRDYGAAIAAEVARRLVMAPFREGDQAQFIRAAPLRNNADLDTSLTDTLTWAGQHLDRPISVSTLAQRAHMSERTFARRFASEIGTTPLAWLLTQRLRRAQELLETTPRSLAEIAHASGFGTVESMRHHFRQSLGTSPARYRSSFAARGLS